MAPLDEYFRKRDFAKTPEPRGREPRAARAIPSSSRSTPPRGCTTTSAWSSTACSRAGPCPRARASTRRRSAWPCRSRTTRSSTATSRASSPRASTAAAPSMLWDRGTWEPIEDPHAGFAQGQPQVQAPRREAHRRLGAGQDQGPRRARPRQDLAADQGEGRVRAAARAVRRDGGAARERHHAGAAWSRSWRRGIGSGSRTSWSRRRPASGGRRCRRPLRYGRAGDRAAAGTGETDGNGGGHRRGSGRQEGRAAEVRGAAAGDAGGRGAGGRRLAARAEVRRLSHPVPHRRRRGHAADAATTRTGRRRFPPIAQAAARAARASRRCSTARSAVLLPDGTTSFHALQNAMEAGLARAARLLRVRPAPPRRLRPDGRPLEERKAALQDLLAGPARRPSPCATATTWRAPGKRSSSRPAG